MNNSEMYQSIAVLLAWSALVVVVAIYDDINITAITLGVGIMMMFGYGMSVWDYPNIKVTRPRKVKRCL